MKSAKNESAEAATPAAENPVIIIPLRLPRSAAADVDELACQKRIGSRTALNIGVARLIEQCI
jgi:hypothetical protein